MAHVMRKHGAQGRINAPERMLPETGACPGSLCFSGYAQRLRDHKIFRFGPPSAGVPLDFSAAPRYNETILEKDGEHHEF
jgi:hypothetical protein